MAGTRAGCHRLLLPKVIVFRCCPPVPLTGARTACTWLFPPVDAASDPGAWTKESPVPPRRHRADHTAHGVVSGSFHLATETRWHLTRLFPPPPPPPIVAGPPSVPEQPEPGSAPPSLPSQCPATCRGTAFVDTF